MTIAGSSVETPGGPWSFLGMTNPTPAAPFVVVPVPGQDALPVALNRFVRDPFAREFLAGMTCGFTVPSAVSLVIAGYGAAHCFDEAAAERWMKALKEAGAFEGQTMEQVLERFTGPFIDKVKAERAERLALLDAEERTAAEAAQTQLAKDAADKLAADQLAADAAAAEALRVSEGLRTKALEEAEAAEAKRLLDEAVKNGNAPVTTAETASNSTSEAEKIAAPEPKPTPPAPEPSTRRGNRTPRGG